MSLSESGPPPDKDAIRLYRFLDELAANAWPAHTQQALEGWRLRATDGLTRRANSVFTVAPAPTYPGWLDTAEDFYRRRGLPSRFQISDGSPPGLDAFLDSNGYRTEAITLVQSAQAREVADRAGEVVGLRVIPSEPLNDDWLDAFISSEGVPENRKATYRSIYSAIGPRTCYLRACLSDERTVGVGMAVTERGWSGLFSIATLPEYRGHGVATHIIALLARWSLQSGAPNLYLQVMEDNKPAVSLYKKLGFSPLYGYHYRTKD